MKFTDEQRRAMRYTPLTTVIVAMAAGFVMGLVVMAAMWWLSTR